MLALLIVEKRFPFISGEQTCGQALQGRAHTLHLNPLLAEGLRETGLGHKWFAGLFTQLRFYQL